MHEDVDPRATVATSPMSGRQVSAIVICLLLNALDGYDVLSISFAAPGIAAEWRIDKAALGLVLSFELIGMSAGSLVLGRLADARGRRPATILCLILMMSGMFLATQVNSVVQLCLARLLTGFGIGGMLAATNAIVAEVANDRRRDLCVSLMAGGYPVGAIVGGLAAAHILSIGGDWRTIFAVGAAAAAILVPIVIVGLPETIAYLVSRRPVDALRRMNGVLRTFGHAPVREVPPAPKSRETAWSDLLTPPVSWITLCLTTAYLAHIMTFYFVLKWLPKIVVDLGFSAASGANVLVLANVGGVCGALLLSVASVKFAIRGLIIAAMILSFLMVSLLGAASSSVASLAVAATCAGFCTNAGVVGLYALIAKAYPDTLRAGGTGLVIGIGRGGSALAPLAAGLLFELGAGLPAVAAIMATGSLIAAAALGMQARLARIDHRLANGERR